MFEVIFYVVTSVLIFLCVNIFIEVVRKINRVDLSFTGGVADIIFASMASSFFIFYEHVPVLSSSTLKSEMPYI